ncbi:3-hydroxyacyl-ACP dehydratase FabZ [Bartonella rattaustraliani]|uniref:3-hydroxyacyl-ACP dehydratase FabZ n=1 Tax=Bartonella rattaustraliani TaxID=481139 RepID=UPI0002EE5A3E|nr:3-hydroxyacyl-ACP dehydratase FabZ [Bartonella rattaustraliani]
MVNTGEMKNLEALDIEKLLSILPHRYPFLLIDRIVRIDDEQEAIGVKNVTVNEPHFVGHFPEKPVMPGVLILEAMAQTAGAIALLRLGNKKTNLVYLITVDNAKFRRPVVPGDQLKIHVQLLKKRANMRRFSCVAKVDDVCVAEAKIAAMIIEEE